MFSRASTSSQVTEEAALGVLGIDVSPVWQNERQVRNTRLQHGTRSEPLYKTKTGYYEILEVTSDATQAQIKTAYYKQSFVYHPDRNAGSDAATVRFSEISEAYTVLGNKALKKKYDRGLLSQSDLTASVRPPPPPAGTPPGAPRNRGVFDFDRFFKEHYGEQLQRQKDVSARKEELLKRKHESIADKKLIGVTEVGLMLMLLMAVTLIVSLKRGH
uniref:DnaJ homolog subfamily C member 30, mitochondrial n=1 Tax=Labrus bergylta TaxID=56723 RepID=A0A3Q3FBR5_9LABR